MRNAVIIPLLLALLVLVLGIGPAVNRCIRTATVVIIRYGLWAPLAVAAAGRGRGPMLMVLLLLRMASRDGYAVVCRCRKCIVVHTVRR